MKYARFLHRLKIKRMRLVGNGEEIRLRLNEKSSQRSYSGASDIVPLCIASQRPATL